MAQPFLDPFDTFDTFQDAMDVVPVCSTSHDKPRKPFSVVDPNTQRPWKVGLSRVQIRQLQRAVAQDPTDRRYLAAICHWGPHLRR